MSATAVAARTPVRRQARPSFVGAVRGEVLKLSRQRILWALLIGGTLLLLLVSATFFGNENLRDQYRGNHQHFFVQAFYVLGTLFDVGAGIVLLISSSRLFGMEYAAGTIRVLLARGMGRLQLYLAKLVALLLLGALLFLGYAALAAGMLLVSIQAWGGSGIGLDSVSAGLLKWVVVDAWTSVGMAILLGSTAAIVGRSLAFGIGVAMGFFPADNFGTLILYILQRITHLDFFVKISDYLLGPNLNVMVSVAQPKLALKPAFAPPFDTPSLEHIWTVVAVYAAVFLVASIALISRRDVLE